MVVFVIKTIRFIWLMRLIKKKRVLLFETPCDLQPILCFNIISGSKRYGLFPILSGLIEPSLRNFRISLSNGLFPPVRIGDSIPSSRTVLESFLTHTAQRSILVVSRFFNLPHRIEWDLSETSPPCFFYRVNKKRKIVWVSNLNLG